MKSLLSDRNFVLSVAVLAVIGVAATAMQSASFDGGRLLGQATESTDGIPTRAYNAREAEAGIIFPGNQHTILTCAGRPDQAFPITGPLMGSDTATRYWVYSYTESQFYISPGELAVSPQFASINTLREFRRGQTYYVMSENDLPFQCGRGIEVPQRCGNNACDTEEVLVKITIGILDPAMKERINGFLRGSGADALFDFDTDGDNDEADRMAMLRSLSTDRDPEIFAAVTQALLSLNPSYTDFANILQLGNLRYCQADCGAAVTTSCGNGTLETAMGEQCDDGNMEEGDGCAGLCSVENGFSCTGAEAELSTCMPVIPELVAQPIPAGETVTGEPAFHSVCASGVCTIVEGAGENACTSDADCGTAPSAEAPTEASADVEVVSAALAPATGGKMFSLTLRNNGPTDTTIVTSRIPIGQTQILSLQGPCSFRNDYTVECLSVPAGQSRTVTISVAAETECMPDPILGAAGTLGDPSPENNMMSVVCS